MEESICSWELLNTCISGGMLWGDNVKLYPLAMLLFTYRCKFDFSFSKLDIRGGSEVHGREDVHAHQRNGGWM